MENEHYCEDKAPQKLYKIGTFSQLNRVTVKALRYYDEINLLKPDYVDQINGYRYYTSGQLPKLHKILSMREMGFSLDEIKKVMDGASEEQLLLKKKSELHEILARTSSKIAHIESYLAGSCLHSDYHIVMKSLPEVTIASMSLQLKDYEELFSKMPLMGMEMESAGCECAVPEYCFTIYYDEEYRESDIHAEICEAVTQMKEDQGNIKFRVLPEVELAACVLHKGPYSNLPQAYGAIVQFIEESGYEIIGHQREFYIDGVWNKDSEEEWLTEIQFPVRKDNAY